MSSFLEYLGSLKSKLSTLGPTTELCLTCGNQSCDLDSVASALVYAHYQAQGSEHLHIPLLQCRRAELAFKQDVQLLLDKLMIDSSWLCCLDDIAPVALSVVGKLSLVLVDHNAPTGMLESYSPNVVKVIDHHAPAQESVANKPGVSTIMETVGSCSSLVAGELLKDESYTVEPPAATLLLSAILLDTGNLQAAARVTEVDKITVEELSKLLPSSFHREPHFSELLRARFDISKLAVQQVLERDFKQCRENGFTIGFSSVTALLTDFLLNAADTLNSDFMEFQLRHKLDAFLVLGISMSDPTEVRRQIAVFQPDGVNQEFTESIVNMLEAEDSLKCERLVSTPGFSGALLDQGNPEMSRKQVLPMVTAFIRSIEPEDRRSSPSQVLLQEAELTSSAAVLGVASEQPYPLEPSITILSSPTVDDHRSFPPSGEDTGSPPPSGEDNRSPPPSGEGHGSPPPSDASKAAAAPIPEYTSAEECKDRRARRYVSIGGEEISVSMDIVEPYRKIIQHAGYIGETRQALVILSACYLPPRSLPNYNHVIHHTFYYVLSVLDQLIVDDYTIVYLHSGAPRNSFPSIPVLHRFYKNIDRRLRKQLTQLFIVHPTFWVKTMLRLARPFISKKFWRKVHFIPTLQDLTGHVDLDEQYISAPVAAMDKLIMSRRPTSQKYMTEEQKFTGASTTTDASTATDKQASARSESSHDKQTSETTEENKQDMQVPGSGPVAKNEE